MSRYELTFEMRLHIMAHGLKWRPYEMSQEQCQKVGFLSGARGDYYCYNNSVQRCGDVIKFRNNCIGNSSVSTKYAYL